MCFQTNTHPSSLSLSLSSLLQPPRILMAFLHSSESFEIKTSSEPSVLDIEASKTTPEGNHHGICLTWKDIWVNTIAKGKNGRRSILQGLTGYAKPGQLLAIMGPSGCGKSTLLDTLAGTFIS